MASTIKAVIFDFDGLIMDTEWISYSVWQNIYQSHGVTLKLENWIKCVGTHDGVFNPFMHLEELKGQTIDKEKTRKEHLTRKHEQVSQLGPLPGVESKILEIKSLGLHTSVASSSGREWVVGHLQRSGMFKHFEHVCTKDDVKHVKPDPELYLLAASRMGVEPRDCLAFEDSANGLIAAKAAGMKCVAVPNRVTLGSDFSKADLVMTSLAERSLTQILNILK